MKLILIKVKINSNTHRRTKTKQKTNKQQRHRKDKSFFESCSGLWSFYLTHWDMQKKDNDEVK